jgi:hypothetical protein
MLTNAYETQVVQSLGVRIGPEVGASASNVAGTDEETERGASTSGAGCPFAAMMPAMEVAPDARLDPSRMEGPAPSGERIPVRWTSAAEARLANIPAFIRPMARTGIERFARERGVLEVDEKVLDAAREFFGM